MANYSGTNAADSYWGGAEADRIEGLGGHDYLNGNGGNDEIFGGDGNDNLHGHEGDDLLEGGSGDDLLSAQEGVDILRGQAGNDRLLLTSYGGLAGDWVDGGEGVDRFEFDGLSVYSPIVFSIADPAVAQNIAGATIVNVERLTFRSGYGNDDITGGALDDYIDGFDGDDRIDGGLGNDTLNGGMGTDTIYGGGGNDLIYGGIANLLYGGEGDDTFRWEGDALIDGGAGYDKLTAEYVYYGTNAPGITVDLSDPSVETLVLGTRVIGIEQISVTSGSGHDRLTGGAGDDSLVGNGGDDILVGAAGKDTLNGGDGNDRLSGGAGDDLLYNFTTDSNPADLFDGGDGLDSLDFHLRQSSASATIDLLSATGMVTNVERISFSAYSSPGNHNISGGDLEDTIWGDEGGDVIKGRGGNDDLRGNGGDDVIEGGAGNDYITGDGGSNRLEGGEGNDYIQAYGPQWNLIDGGAGDDQLSGGEGGDTLIGGDGIDVIFGVGGGDMMAGGAGADRFAYYGVGDSSSAAMDRITDFQSGLDKIDLELLGKVRINWTQATDPGTGKIYSLVTIGAGTGTATIRVDSALSRDDFIADATFGGGTPGDDILTGDSGANLLDGGAGNDQIHGNGGNDDLRGGTGNDALYVSGIGIVVANGGADFDTLSVDWSDTATEITMGYAYDDPNGGVTGSLWDGAGRQVDYSSMNILHIKTGSGNDLVQAGQAGSSASLGGGDDRYHGAGAETVDGGAGVDGVSAGLHLTSTPIVWNLQTNSHSGLIGSYTNFEHFLGLLAGSANDVVVTTDANLDDIVSLGAGDDVLTVLNGRDRADGDLGNDLLIIDYSASTSGIHTVGGAEGITPGSAWSGVSGVSGQIGDGSSRRVEFFNVDRFDVRTGSGHDLIVLGTGGLVTNDLVSLGEGNDFADFGRGTDQGDGGAGVDGLAADLSLATVSVSINLATNQFSGPAGASFVNFEHFAASGFRTGSGDDAVVTGQLALDDLVRLGAGADNVTVHHGFDNVDGQSGIDRLIVDYSSATTAVSMIGAIALSTDGAGLKGRIGDIGYRRVDFDNFERLDVRTGSGNDNLQFGSMGLSTDDIASLGGGDDLVDFGGGIDVGDGGSGVDGFGADLSGATVAISIDLTANSFSGPAGASFVNFEYFAASGFQTGAGADVVVTALLELSDRVALGSGNDTITLYNGWDTVFGGAAGAGAANSGFDTLVLDYGASTSAISNLDPIQTDAAGASGRIGDGANRVAAFQAIDRFVITTGSGSDSIATAGFNDEIRTGGGADSISAGGGDDLLDGGAGADSMTGGTGNDVYFVDHAGDAVVENAGEGIDEVRTSLATASLAAYGNIENITGISATGQTLIGNSLNNVVTGGAGNDNLRLQDGGNDTALGGGGNDNIFMIGSLTAADVLDGGAGADTLVLQGAYAGGLTLSANVTNIELISILAGSNTNFGEPGTNRHDYVLTVNDANFSGGTQVRINGGALLEGEDFIFDGSAELDSRFVVYGGRGKDTLLGSQNADIFFLAEERFATGDTVNGGAGYDGMFLRGNYTIDFNAPGYTGLFTNIENLTLTSASDERYARGGGTEFDYNLTLSDAIVKPGETLTISGALLMANETMILDASAETDGFLSLFGGKASDTLKGGALSDVIYGNLGADQLTGNGGADSFRYQLGGESTASSLDHILDFAAGVDKVDLSRMDADTNTAGNQAFSWIGSNTFSGSAGQLRAYQDGASWFAEGDTNGDGIADLVIQLTVTGGPLGQGDFLP